MSEQSSVLAVAFQPIVNLYNGQPFGFEVFVRSRGELGYRSPRDILDGAYYSGSLGNLELTVRKLAAAGIAKLPDIKDRFLFLNLDHRLWDHSADIIRTQAALGEHAAHIVTEISGHPGDEQSAASWVRELKIRNGLVAVDRYGNTNDGLRLILDSEPDFVKIDRTLVRRADSDRRRRTVVSQIIAMCHAMGIRVVAVGVEDDKELLACREMGFDLAQGFFIQPPVDEPERIGARFPHVEEVVRLDRRRRVADQPWIINQLDTRAPFTIDRPVMDVFDLIANDANISFVPVVDRSGQPLGVILEKDLKNMAYSTYGKHLLANRGLGRRLVDFLAPCPIAEISTPIDELLAAFAAQDEAPGILITENMIYRGFLSARSIIRVMHEKTVARARDENPLTKLPGNTLINEYLMDALASGEKAVLVYVDFDNFKPFNDTYGFRQGDRAILMFAELMRRSRRGESWFLGHIGGDDFFIGIRDLELQAAGVLIADLIDQFAINVQSFYDSEARERGGIVALDRDGNRRFFPLLSASATLVQIPANCTTCKLDDVVSLIASLKKEAKQSPTKLASASLAACSPIEAFDAEIMAS